jgi:hypothetical protein
MPWPDARVFQLDPAGDEDSPGLAFRFNDATTWSSLSSRTRLAQIKCCRPLAAAAGLPSGRRGVPRLPMRGILVHIDATSIPIPQHTSSESQRYAASRLVPAFMSISIALSCTNGIPE